MANWQLAAQIGRMNYFGSRPEAHFRATSPHCQQAVTLSLIRGCTRLRPCAGPRRTAGWCTRRPARAARRLPPRCIPGGAPRLAADTSSNEARRSARAASSAASCGADRNRAPAATGGHQVSAHCLQNNASSTRWQTNGSSRPQEMGRAGLHEDDGAPGAVRLRVPKRRMSARPSRAGVPTHWTPGASRSLSTGQRRRLRVNRSAMARQRPKFGSVADLGRRQHDDGAVAVRTEFAPTDADRSRRRREVDAVALADRTHLGQVARRSRPRARCTCLRQGRSAPRPRSRSRPRPSRACAGAGLSPWAAAPPSATKPCPCLALRTGSAPARGPRCTPSCSTACAAARPRSDGWPCAS